MYSLFRAYIRMRLREQGCLRVLPFCRFVNTQLANRFHLSQISIFQFQLSSRERLQFRIAFHFLFYYLVDSMDWVCTPIGIRGFRSGSCVAQACNSLLFCALLLMLIAHRKKRNLQPSEVYFVPVPNVEDAPKGLANE